MDSLEKFNDYSLNDFVWNKQFRDCVLYPNDSSHAFRNNWLIEHPDKMALINAAKEVVLCLDTKELRLSEKAIDEVVQDTLRKIKIKERHRKTHLQMFLQFDVCYY